MNNNAYAANDQESLGSLNDRFEAARFPDLNAEVDAAVTSQDVEQSRVLMTRVEELNIPHSMEDSALKSRRVKRCKLPVQIQDKKEARPIVVAKIREARASERADMFHFLQQRRLARAKQQHRVDNAKTKPRKSKRDREVDMSKPSAVKRQTIQREPFKFVNVDEEKFLAPQEDYDALIQQQQELVSNAGRSFSRAALQSRAYYRANGEVILATMDEQIQAWQDELREVMSAKPLDDIYCRLRAVVVAYDRVHCRNDDEDVQIVDDEVAVAAAPPVA